MEVVLLVMFGSALGGMARYGLSGVIAERAGVAFPWGTTCVNVLGSFAIGVVFGTTGTAPLLVDAPSAHLLLTYGVLGGFTTFSTFSLETLNLLREGERRRAAIYAAGSVVVCVVGAAAGFLTVAG